MNNGSQRRELLGKRNIFRGDEFAYALTRMAVAQICESVEISSYQAREGVRFTSFQESALETLTGVVTHYIQNIGKTAQFYANMAGRVEANSLDIVQALEDLGFGLGFDGAPDIEHCLVNSCVVKDIIHYTGKAGEMPFVYSLPCFPFNKGKRRAPSFAEIGVEPPDEHIPVWLPAFPETKFSNDDKIEEDVHSKENGLPLDVDMLKIQKSMDQKDVPKPTEEPEGNPFLAAPVWVGEKNVAPHVFYPPELTNEEICLSNVLEKQMNQSHHIPPLEASDMINNKNRLAETEEDGARSQGALLSFKIGTRKVSVCWMINQSLHEKGWFQKDGDKMKQKR